jgi:hypothetical protein
MRTVWPRLLAGLVAGVLLLGGCGENPEPKQLPKPSKSSSPSASASPTPPAMPAAAKEKTKAGAIAFARHYIDLINFAQSTGDLRALQAVEGRTCKSCAQAESYLERLYGSGGTIRGGDFEVLSASALKNPSTHGWLVELGVRFGPQVVDHPSPKPDEHPKGGRLPLNIQVAHRSSDWSVLEWTRGA